MTATMRTAALELAAAGWPVFPLRGKTPRIAKRDGGHGHLDGTCDVAQIEAWWDQWPKANVGARVPDRLVLLDVDPREGGHATYAKWKSNFEMPETLTAWSGGADRGWHTYWLNPGCPLTARSLKDTGVDLKMPGKGYAVMPPSRHPDSGRRYRWADVAVPPAPLPAPLLALLRQPPPKPRPSHQSGMRTGDVFAASTSWDAILVPHGWQPARKDGLWIRPGKDRGTSGSVTTGSDGTEWLHVFTPNAGPLESERNYTKFTAWATLNHGGDYRAAAKALRSGARR